MDSMNEKGLRNYLATGEMPTAVAVVVQEKPDPIRMLLVNLCAVGMLAKDLHYRSKGKAFYAVHQLSDIVWDATRLFDELNEVWYLGECGSVPPLMSKTSAFAAKLAELGNDRPIGCDKDEEDCILSALIARCKATAGLVEDCKSLAPKSGTNAVLDEISKKMLQAVGLLQRTEMTPSA